MTESEKNLAITVSERFKSSIHRDGDKFYENTRKIGYIRLGDEWVQFGPEGITPKKFQEISIQLEEWKESR